MSTSQSDLEQNSSIHSETDVSSMTSALCIILQTSSIHSETDVSSMTSGEKLETPKMSTLQSDMEQNSSIHSESDVSSMTSGEQLGEMEQSSPTPHEQTGEEEGWKGDLLHAICVNSWNDVKAILDQNPKALTAEINDKRGTALHVAAMFGHVTIVKELLKLLPPEFLETPDPDSCTALALACQYNGSVQVVKCLVNTNRDLLGIENGEGDLPVAQAIKLHLTELGRYLYCLTPLKFLTDHRGSKLLHYCFKAQCLDIALDLLQRCEELLLVRWNEGSMPILGIASLNTTIPSPSELVFWKRWIYDYMVKSSSIAKATNHVCVDIQQKNRSQEDKAKLSQQGHGLLQKLVTSANDFVGVKQIQELKLQHERADILLDLVCKNARKAYQKGVMYDALIKAAKEGNSKFLLQVSKEIPEIFVSRYFFTFFSEALQHRQAKVFNLIYGLRLKTNVLNSVFNDGDTMLRKAAIQANRDILNRIYAPTLQMQNELQWFKEVENLTPSTLRGFRDRDGKTSKELFREEHRDLMKEGEEWIKKTATSCSVVGTLIMTIMFTAATIVPGGNDQNLGYPLFLFTTIFSLLSSTASVLMFLAILTSQYSEDQFIKSLPTKLIMGLSFLFISILCMMIAFLSTIDLMMKHTQYSWILPITILASVPIFLFVRSQFPLLLHTYVSTYGNLFDRKVEPWP